MKHKLAKAGTVLLKLFSLMKRPDPVARHVPWDGSEEDFFDKMLNESTYAVSDGLERSFVTTYHDKETHAQIGMCVRWPNRFHYFVTKTKS